MTIVHAQMFPPPSFFSVCLKPPSLLFIHVPQHTSPASKRPWCLTETNVSFFFADTFSWHMILVEPFLKLMNEWNNFCTWSCLVQEKDTTQENLPFPPIWGVIKENSINNVNVVLCWHASWEGLTPGITGLQRQRLRRGPARRYTPTSSAKQDQCGHSMSGPCSRYISGV